MRQPCLYDYHNYNGGFKNKIMARRKIPQNESPKQKRTRQIKETIAGLSNRSEKVSFSRKMDNMVKLMSQLQPIEDKILDLFAQKIPIYDQIQELRSTMVEQCVHPYEYLEIQDDLVVCKFCNRKISLPNQTENDGK